MDERGERWDVLEALNSSIGVGGGRHRKPCKEVLLERWRIELKSGSQERIYDFASILPTIYKKSIVFFRALFTTSKIVPSCKFVKALSKSGPAAGGLRVNCRIITGDDLQVGSTDPLEIPLYNGDQPVTSQHALGETETPAGRFCASVTYRNDCNFRVDDSEALLSSRFMGADEHFFTPSLNTRGDSRRKNAKTIEVGSLPAHHRSPEDREPIQAYGSLSTFHGDAPPLGSSPISALRAMRPMGSDTSSPPVGSAPRTRPINSSRGSLRSGDGFPRRPSVSFQPFKAGSLSGSPATPSYSSNQPGEMMPPPSPQSFNRTSGISALAQARNRSSLTAGMPSSLRGVPIVESATPSASSSPRPSSVNKYSSSFTHRRNRPSYGGTSKIDDDQTSSGKQSLSSSAQPGSGILAEGAGGSSGSLQTDDDNISEFLKLLDTKRTLKSFEPANAAESSTKRTSAALSKFQMMKESNNALTDSMSSSIQLNRSSSSSSRQLSSVPPMVAASMSTSSSPGKPVSPHTPHTPAIPSRLSANSIAEYNEPRRLSHRPRAPSEIQAEEEGSSNSAGTNAIDIPTSPRPFYPHNRRSSSVAQQHRHLAVDDDMGDLPFGPHRSISLGADDREAPSLSALLGAGQPSDPPASDDGERMLQPAAHIADSSSLNADREEGPQMVPRGLIPGAASSSFRPRLGRAAGRGTTPPQTGSYSSLVADRGTGSGTSGTSDRPSGRYSFTRPSGNYDADDEPLLFDMSEIGRGDGRRSIEEGRGGGSIGSEGRGGYDSASSSRRGSRRGW